MCVGLMYFKLCANVTCIWNLQMQALNQVVNIVAAVPYYPIMKNIRTNRRLSGVLR